MASTGKLINKKKLQCSFCDSINLSKVINFGDVALAGAFLEYDEIRHEKKYPPDVSHALPHKFLFEILTAKELLCLYMFHKYL